VSSSISTTHVKTRPRYGDAWGLAYTAIAVLSELLQKLFQHQQFIYHPCPTVEYHYTSTKIKQCRTLTSEMQQRLNTDIIALKQWVYVQHKHTSYYFTKSHNHCLKFFLFLHKLMEKFQKMTSKRFISWISLATT